MLRGLCRFCWAGALERIPSDLQIRWALWKKLRPWLADEPQFCVEFRRLLVVRVRVDICPRGQIIAEHLVDDMAESICSDSFALCFRQQLNIQSCQIMFTIDLVERFATIPD